MTQRFLYQALGYFILSCSFETTFTYAEPVYLVHTSLFFFVHFNLDDDYLVRKN